MYEVKLMATKSGYGWVRVGDPWPLNQRRFIAWSTYTWAPRSMRSRGRHWRHWWQRWTR